MSSIREWQDFGQRVDLTANIRKILLDYPEGTSIFKELIQVRCAQIWRIRRPLCGIVSEGSRATHTGQLLAKYACLKTSNRQTLAAARQHVSFELTAPFVPQNADDAGARTISFCLDARTHGSESLAYGGLASLQVGT